MNVTSRSICTSDSVSITQRCYEHLEPQNPKRIDELFQRIFKKQAQSRQNRIDAKMPEISGAARVSGKRTQKTEDRFKAKESVFEYLMKK